MLTVTKRYLFGLILFGVCLRFFHLGSQSLNWDELDTYMIINKTFVGSLKDIISIHTRHPPMYFFVVKIWTMLAGTSELSLRFPSMVFSVFSILALYLLGKELFGKNAGFFSAVFATFSAYHINYAQDARMYAMFWCLVSFSFLFFLRFLKSNSQRDLTYHILSTSLCIYTMYSGLVLVIVQAFYVILVYPKRLKQFSLAFMIIALSYLPWIAVFYRTAVLHNGINWIPKTNNYFLFFIMAFRYLIGISLGNNVPFEWA